MEVYSEDTYKQFLDSKFMLGQAVTKWIKYPSDKWETFVNVVKQKYPWIVNFYNKNVD